MGNPEWNGPLGRHRRSWKDNIKMDRREIEYGDMDWINLVQNMDQWRSVASMVMNFRVS
jgi:hypothetical protein